MLILSDQNWIKARARIVALGHAEESDRFEPLVRAAYEEERRRGHLLLKNSGIGKFLLMKAVGMESKPFQVKRKPVKGKPVVDGWAQGQRPGQKTPVHGRISAIGKDGMVIRDDKGRRHRIRHEHIVEHQPPLSDKDWPKAAKAMADSGEKIDPVSRFTKKPRRARPDAKAKRRLNTLGKKHKDLDVKRALKEATPDEVAMLIEHYKAQPVLKKVKKSASVPYDTFDENDPEYLRHAPCQTCDHLHRLPENVRSVGNEGHVWTNCQGHGGCQERVHAEPVECKMCGHSGIHRPEDQEGYSCTKCPECRARVDVPDQLPPDIRNMKSQAVFTAHIGDSKYTHEKDGYVSHITRERPGRSTKILGRTQVGRIPFVTIATPERPAHGRLSEKQWDARKTRGANVRTRVGTYMDPTESSIKRIRGLAGKVKMLHNERERSNRG